MKQTHNKQRQGGFTITELMLVLSVGAVIIGAAFLGYKAVSDNTMTQQNMVGTSTLLSSVKNKWQGVGSYSAVTDAAIIASGLINKPFSVSGGAIYNVFEKQITFSGQARDFRAAFEIPSDKCIDAAGALDGVAYRIDIDSAAVAASASEDATKTVKPAGGTIDGNKVTSQCGGATTVISAWVK